MFILFFRGWGMIMIFCDLPRCGIEPSILARAEAAVQGILQILDSACQAKTVSEAGVSMVGKTHRF